MGVLFPRKITAYGRKALPHQDRLQRRRHCRTTDPHHPGFGASGLQQDARTERIGSPDSPPVDRKASQLRRNAAGTHPGIRSRRKPGTCRTVGFTQEVRRATDTGINPTTPTATAQANRQPHG